MNPFYLLSSILTKSKIKEAMKKKLWALIDTLIENDKRLILDDEGVRVVDVVELRYFPANSWISLNPDYASEEEIEEGIKIAENFLLCH